MDSLSVNNNNGNVAGRDINIYPKVEPDCFVVLMEELASLFDGDLSDLPLPKNVKTINKIMYNQLQSKMAIIKEYGDYIATIDDAKNIVSDRNPASVGEAVLYLRNKYLNIIDKNITSNGDVNIDYVKSNATEIWNSIKENIQSELKPSNISIFGYTLEIFMVYAFMKCRIFEEPK